MPRVFISHSSADRERVDRDIVATLRANGIDTWLSGDDISGAEAWERSIRDALNACDWFLVAVTPRAVESEWVQTEVEWALENRPGRVLPVLLEDRCHPGDLHLKLVRLQFVDLRTPTPQALRHLLAPWKPGEWSTTGGWQATPANGAAPIAPTAREHPATHVWSHSLAEGLAPIRMLEDTPHLVLHARDVRRDTHVVVRIIDTAGWASVSREHLVRAARASTKLDHPAVARYLSVDELTSDDHGDGHRTRIVSEFIPSARPLHEVIWSSPSFDQSADLLARTAGGLHYCHIRGYVNGRLHPRTVLVDERGPHLVDLGVVRAAGRLDPDRVPPDRPASFEAPEVSAGGEPTPRSDVFSIGVMLYEALAARRPFESIDLLAYYANRFGRAVRSAIKSPRQMDSRVPAELDRICMKCLAANPDERYATAADLSDDLRRWRVPARRHWFF